MKISLRIKIFIINYFSALNEIIEIFINSITYLINGRIYNTKWAVHIPMLIKPKLLMIRIKTQIKLKRCKHEKYVYRRKARQHCKINNN